MKQSAKKVLIIGGGIGGLSAGCFAQMNGFDSTIFEMHPQQSGGFVCGWDRKGYTVEGCIHHMAGLGDNDIMFQKVYKPIGCFATPNADDRIFHKSLIRIDDYFGRFPSNTSKNSIEIFSNLNDLENELFPFAETEKDLKLLEFYVDLVKTAQNFSFFDFMHRIEHKNSKFQKLMYVTKPSNLKHLYKLIYGGRMSLGKFAAQFDSEFLKNAFPLIQYDFPGIPLFLNATFVGSLSNSLGTIKGGGKQMAKNMEKRYKELGGNIKLASKVERIVTKDIGKGKTLATGIILQNGQKIDGDIVISCCDGLSTYNNLLNQKNADYPANIDPNQWKLATPKAKKYFNPKNYKKEQMMGFHLALGVKRQFPDIPFLYTFFLPKDSEIEILGKKLDHLMIENFTFDKTMAPEGKTVLKISMKSGYSEWRELRAESLEKYNAKKKEIAEKLIGVLEMRFPGIGKDVEMIDTHTPVTAERYTGNFQGSQPFGSKDTQFGLFTEQFMTIPKLHGFYAAGMWARGVSGLNFASISGKNVKEIL